MSIKKAIMIFGAGEGQAGLIKAARELGFLSVVIDPSADAYARAQADVFAVVAPRDKKLTLELVKKYDVKGLVTGQMENPLLLMAEIASACNFAFPSITAIANCRDKFLMKKAFIAAGVPCAKGIKIKASNIIETALDDYQYPLIMKPLNAFSSRGVFKLNSYQELQAKINETLQFSSNQEVLIEEFLSGREFSVESLTYNGHTNVIQITQKTISPAPYTVEMAHAQPADVSNAEADLIKKATIAAIKATGIDNCASHCELKINDGKCYIIEIGARLGGDFISSYLTEYSCGVSMEAGAVNIAMGQAPQVTKIINKYSLIKYLQLPVGKQIVKINEPDKVLELPGVGYYMLMIKAGDTISAITDSAKRPGLVIVQAESKIEAQEIANQALEVLKQTIELEEKC